MHRPIVLSVLILASAAGTHLLAQTPAQPAASPSPSPATLRSVLLADLHSTHDKAEWFTPMNTAVSGLTAEQAKWIPQNAQGKHDSNANHSVGMLAYHLVFWNENALLVCRATSQRVPVATTRLLMTSTPRTGPTSCSASTAS